MHGGVTQAPAVLPRPVAHRWEPVTTHARCLTTEVLAVDIADSVLAGCLHDIARTEDRSLQHVFDPPPLSPDSVEHARQDQGSLERGPDDIRAAREIACTRNSAAR
jgi:hypothetical protein